jgi:hypothetical protein
MVIDGHRGRQGLLLHRSQLSTELLGHQGRDERQDVERFRPGRRCFGVISHGHQRFAQTVEAARHRGSVMDLAIEGHCVLIEGTSYLVPSWTAGSAPTDRPALTWWQRPSVHSMIRVATTAAGRCPRVQGDVRDIAYTLMSHRTVYGGLLEASLSEDELVLIFDEQAQEIFGWSHTLTLRLAVSEQDRQALRAGLRAVLAVGPDGRVPVLTLQAPPHHRRAVPRGGPSPLGDRVRAPKLSSGSRIDILRVAPAGLPTLGKRRWPHGPSSPDRYTIDRGTAVQSLWRHVDDMLTVLSGLH